MSRYKFMVFIVTACSGCATMLDSKSQSLMDPYDPRNNIPLLQAATRTSGVNVKTNASADSLIPSVGSNPSAQKLREIKALKDEGILTQKEYDAKKAEILKGM